MNGSSCFIPLNRRAEKIGTTFAYCLIFVVSLLGNSFIGIIVYKTKALRTPINFFMVNMAMSDLLYPIFLLPWDLTHLYAGSWLISGSLGQALCKLVPFLADVSTVVSIQSLVLIAVDRFGAVVFPLRSPLISLKRCPFFILATWIIATAVCLPYLFAFKLVESQGQLVCELRWNEAFGESSSLGNFFLSTFVVFFYIPITLLATIYIIILIKLKTQKFPGGSSVKTEKRRRKRNRSVLKMAIAIVLGFVLCWVPFSITTLLHFFEWEGGWPCGNILYLRILMLIARVNCATNPCICLIFSPNYRAGLKRLVKCFSAVQKKSLQTIHVTRDRNF